MPIMIPLADVHCHLLTGLDDGPQTDQEALTMCRIAVEEGIRMIAATAHQNERYRAVTPDRIRMASKRLVDMVRDEGIHLSVFPCAEVMVHADIESAWVKGELLSVADRGQYLLVEMPHGIFVDLCATIKSLIRTGVRPILAHPERHPELLHEPGRIDELIAAGCLVQVSSGSITDPPSREDAWAIKRWVKRGVVHLLGSDGHSTSRRPPRMADAYCRIAKWAGPAAADRICSTNSMATLHGLPLHICRPKPESPRWIPRFL
jgi:protein-tyrosine phosphatase